MSSCFGATSVSAGVAPNAKWTHCLRYREALASKQLSGDLKGVLEIVVKIVNIQTKPLKFRLFQRPCDKLVTEHDNLLLHCNSTKLSKGKVLFRVYKMRNGIIIFLKEKKTMHLLLHLNMEFSWRWRIYVIFLQN